MLAQIHYLQHHAQLALLLYLEQDLALRAQQVALLLLQVRVCILALHLCIRPLVARNAHSVTVSILAQRVQEVPTAL